MTSSNNCCYFIFNLFRTLPAVLSIFFFLEHGSLKLLRTLSILNSLPCLERVMLNAYPFFEATKMKEIKETVCRQITLHVSKSNSLYSWETVFTPIVGFDPSDRGSTLGPKQGSTPYCPVNTKYYKERKGLIRQRQGETIGGVGNYEESVGKNHEKKPRQQKWFCCDQQQYKGRWKEGKRVSWIYHPFWHVLEASLTCTESLLVNSFLVFESIVQVLVNYSSWNFLCL